MSKIARATCALAAAALLPFLGAGTAFADIPIGQTINGNMTYYNDAGYGACGTYINAASEDLVAVSSQWWTTANPNNDPLCQGVSVKVTYNGKTITVPVKDKCPSCAKEHIDLSQAAFQKLAPLDLGNVAVTWSFVRS
jgi:expansin (peptidoglycan-binding protein)